MGAIDKIEIDGMLFDIGGSAAENFRWQYVEGTIYPCSYFNSMTLELMQGGAGLYSCLKYDFDGSEKYIRFSANTGGSLKYLAYVILDENSNVIEKASDEVGKGYVDYEIAVPSDAKTIWLNGNNKNSVHLEVSQNDLMGDSKTLGKLLKEMSRKISFSEKFAWKPMPTGLIAFTFDDSLDDIGAVVDIFIAKGVPCCFGAIPEYLNKGINSGSVGEETVAQAMQRAVDAVGAEVLAHGNANEMVSADNIDDMNFLYNKFVINKQKLIDIGFDVRGTVRVGGNGNICGDARTDVWCRLFFDYGDLYGIEEPYNHPRFSGSTKEQYYNAIDSAIDNKKFTPLLFHGADLDELPRMIDYVIEHGGQVVTYATAYDTYGSTEDAVNILNRVAALENSNGNEVEY